MENLDKTIVDLQKVLKDQKVFNTKIKTIFNKYDKNKNGTIEKKELETLMTETSKEFKTTPPTKEVVDMYMKLVDKNKNGKIEFNEFSSFMKEILTAVLKGFEAAKQLQNLNK